MTPALMLMLGLVKVAEEIAQKQRNHLPLVPDLKMAEVEGQ